MKLTVSVIKLPLICAMRNSILSSHYLALEMIIRDCKNKIISCCACIFYLLTMADSVWIQSAVNVLFICHQFDCFHS